MNDKKLKKVIEKDVKLMKTWNVELFDSIKLYDETLKCAFRSALLFLFCFVAPMLNDFLFGTAEIRENLLMTAFAVGLFIFMLHFMALPKFREYVLLKNTILPKLKASNYIKKAIHAILMKIAIALVAISTVTSILFDFSADPVPAYQMIGFFAFYDLLPFIIIANIIFGLECKRYGLEAFFSLIRSFFRKEDLNNPPNVQHPSNADDSFSSHRPSSINNLSHPYNIINTHSNNDTNRRNW